MKIFSHIVCSVLAGALLSVTTAAKANTDAVDGVTTPCTAGTLASGPDGTLRQCTEDMQWKRADGRTFHLNVTKRRGDGAQVVLASKSFTLDDPKPNVVTVKQTLPRFWFGDITPWSVTVMTVTDPKGERFGVAARLTTSDEASGYQSQKTVEQSVEKTSFAELSPGKAVTVDLGDGYTAVVTYLAPAQTSAPAAAELDANGRIIDPQAPCRSNGQKARWSVGPMQCVDHHWLDLMKTMPPPYYQDQALVEMKTFLVTDASKVPTTRFLSQAAFRVKRFTAMPYVAQSTQGSNVTSEMRATITMLDGDLFSLQLTITQPDGPPVVRDITLSMQPQQTYAVALSKNIELTVQRL